MTRAAEREAAWRRTMERHEEEAAAGNKFVVVLLCLMLLGALVVGGTLWEHRPDKKARLRAALEEAR